MTESVKPRRPARKSTKPKQTRQPKLDYLERLVDSMLSRGAVKVAFGEFHVEFHPGLRPQLSITDSIDDEGHRNLEAKEAVRLAMEKVRQANVDDEENLLWSA